MTVHRHHCIGAGTCQASISVCNLGSYGRMADHQVFHMPGGLHTSSSASNTVAAVQLPPTMSDVMSPVCLCTVTSQGCSAAGVPLLGSRPSLPAGAAHACAHVHHLSGKPGKPGRAQQASLSARSYMHVQAAAVPADSSSAHPCTWPAAASVAWPQSVNSWRQQGQPAAQAGAEVLAHLRRTPLPPATGAPPAAAPRCQQGQPRHAAHQRTGTAPAPHTVAHCQLAHAAEASCVVVTGCRGHVQLWQCMELCTFGPEHTAAVVSTGCALAAHTAQQHGSTATAGGAACLDAALSCAMLLLGSGLGHPPAVMMTSMCTGPVLPSG